jgi:hypothetical protein
MITQTLEKWLLQGKAQYNLHTQGTMASQIVVGDNKTVIITDIWYFPFVDSEESETASNDSWNERMIHQLAIYSKRKRDTLVMRENLQKDLSINGGVIVNNKNLLGMSHFSVFLYHTDLINLEVTHCAPTSSWLAIGGGIADITVENRRQPLGLGKSPSGVFQPAKAYLMPYGTGSAVRAYQQEKATSGIDYNFAKLEYPTEPISVLNPPLLIPDNTGQMNFPIINYGYVTIDSKLGEELM